MTALLRRCGRIAAVLVHRMAIVLWCRMSHPTRRHDGEATGSLAHQLRLALEDLGPAAVKLGQLLSARSDLVPPTFQRELSLLRDRVGSIPPAMVRSELERSLGKLLYTCFSVFDIVPVACASVGQVHRATVEDGRRVAVKVRRPGVRAAIDGDIALLRALLRVAMLLSRRARAYDAITLLDEFAAMLRAETDYTIEAENIDVIGRVFAHDDAVTIPTVFAQLTSESILVMDWVDGVPLNRVEDLNAAGVDRAGTAGTIMHAYAEMLFESDCFHADPHPANLIALPEGRLALVDFGEVGSIDVGTRAALVRLIVAVLGRDSRALGDAIFAASRSTRPVDRAQLGAELARVLAPLADTALQDIKLGAVLRELLRVLRNHGLMLPSDLAVLLKTVIECEGTTNELDPEFDMPSFLRVLALRVDGTDPA
jgi:ubiquinone biosynthesis protein